MKNHVITAAIVLSATTFFCRPVAAQSDAPPVMSTPPVTLEEKQAMYDATVQDRALKIVQSLAMSDTTKSNQVLNAIVAHYHALRARDEAIDAELGSMPKGSAEWRAERLDMFPAMSEPLHKRFIATLSQNLTPAQLEEVKDRMTYGKVQFTYNGYCTIVPGLTDEDKARIMEMLKQAREVAMDGGSSGEKTAIFQEYKNQINDYLKTQGIDAPKAIQEWSDKQKIAEKSPGAATPNSTTPAK